jgi:trehalose 6-phosphate phosphatase
MNWRQVRHTTLESFIQAQRAGLVTDVDGTISPIVSHPDQAVVTDHIRQLLSDLSGAMTLVGVISGRSAKDIRHRVGVSSLAYVGNHGLEHWADDHVEPAPGVDRYRPALESAAAEVNQHDVPGMWVEDKGATLSIHYRQTPDPDLVARRYYPIVSAIARRHGLNFFEGRRIFELRPPLKMNKGTAFRYLVETHHLTAALYIGDDVTDVDAFRVARQLRQDELCFALAVGVESDPTPQAVLESSDILASGVSDVEALLGWLLESFKASAT